MKVTSDTDLDLDLDSLLDLNKMACLLCKRQFDSIEILNKHIAKSNLHKVIKITKTKEEDEKEKKNFIKLQIYLFFNNE
jgi:hypothetical protein